jgi:hypothetical protein
MTGVFPFRNLLVADLSGDVDTGLLRYAARLAACEPGAEVSLVTLPEDPVLRSAASVARSIFAPSGLKRLSCRILPEPDLDALFAEARGCGAQVLLTQHPKGAAEAAGLLRRLTADAPCPVWLLPPGFPSRLRRVVAAVELNAAGAELLGVAYALCSAAAAEELLALHVCFHDGLNQSAEAVESFREQKLLDLFRVTSQINRNGVNCLPRIQESPRLARGVRAVLDDERPDLLVMPAPSSSRLAWLPDRRDFEELASALEVPVLCYRPSSNGSPLWNLLPRDWFAAPEPSFN